MSVWKHDQLMIRGYPVQSQPTPSPLHCDLEHIHRIPSTNCVCVCVCVRVRACVPVYVRVCVLLFEVVFRKLRFIKDMGRIMLNEEALLFFFLIASNIIIISSSSFYSRST